jgi:hypothetical protein
MCEHLFCLCTYFSLMEDRQSKKDLNDAQWSVVKDTTTLMEPFVWAQRLLEGESYIIIQPTCGPSSKHAT